MRGAPLRGGGGEVEGDVPAGELEDVDGQDEHDDPHGRARPVLELADGLHALAQQEQLKRPHEDECHPAEQRLTEEAELADLDHTGPQARHEHDDRPGGQPRLDAVPADGDEAAQQRGQVRAHRAEGDPGEHRVAQTGLLARESHQVHQEEDDDDADAQRGEHVGGAEPEGEQPRGEGVAADGVDVAHPHGEQGEESPVPALGRGEVVVDEVGVDINGRFGGCRRLIFCLCGHEFSCG